MKRRPWMRADLPVGRRVDLLLKAMTLEEKAGQLSQYHVSFHGPALQDWIRAGGAGSVLWARGAAACNALQRLAVEESRLGVPLLFGDDVIHGYRTTYPIPLGEAASWDLDLIERDTAMGAREARAAGCHWAFAPMVDVARDPRWGRIAEGAGEDPYLGGLIAAARVRGFQGTDPAAPDRVAATAKHFAGYAWAEGGRDYNTTDLAARTLEDTVFPPFRAAVGAGVASFMTAFNDLNGMPCTGSRFLMTDVLRARWKFGGFVVSDWNAVHELVVHGVAADDAEAVRMAITAGVDMDMVGDLYRRLLPGLVRNGAVPRRTVDASVRRVLRAKFRLGIFDRPFADPAAADAITLTPAHREQARVAARRSCVLLKNDAGLLPLAPGPVAVIGPLADDAEAPLGTWNCLGLPADVVTVLAGLRAAAGGTVTFERGCEVDGGGDDGFAAAVAAARAAGRAVMVLGESAPMSGEGGSRTEIGLPGRQDALLRAVHATGVPVVLVLLHGRPLALAWAAEHVPAILAAWHPGTEGGHGVADLVFGAHAPSGRLPVSFPRRVGQVPVYYNHRSTGRPPLDTDRTTSKYLDVPNTPQWPFGHGLTFTTFAYANLAVTPARARHPGTVTVAADVTNTGPRAGEETVQLYVRDEVGSLTRPVRELKGFERVMLQPGETRRVSFRLATAALAFRTAAGREAVEPGAFRVWIGPDAASGVEGRFSLSAASGKA